MDRCDAERRGSFPAQYLRHDARQVEEFCREIGHVAVEKDEEGLDDADVGGEAGGECCDDAVDHANKDASQGHHKEAEEAQDNVLEGDFIEGGKLFKEVVEDLERGGEEVSSDCAE